MRRLSDCFYYPQSMPSAVRIGVGIPPITRAIAGILECPNEKGVSIDEASRHHPLHVPVELHEGTRVGDHCVASFHVALIALFDDLTMCKALACACLDLRSVIT